MKFFSNAKLFLERNAQKDIHQCELSVVIVSCNCRRLLDSDCYRCFTNILLTVSEGRTEKYCPQSQVKTERARSFRATRVFCIWKSFPFRVLFINQNNLSDLTYREKQVKNKEQQTRKKNIFSHKKTWQEKRHMQYKCAHLFSDKPFLPFFFLFQSWTPRYSGAPSKPCSFE